MSNYGSADVGFLLADGFDLLGTTTDLKDNKMASTEDKMGLGAAWPDHGFTGLLAYELSQQGFFDDTAGLQNEAMVANGPERVLCFGHAGNVQSRKMVGVAGALQVKYVRVVKKGEFHKGNAEYKADGIVEDGIVDHIHQTETAASGETSSIDNAASSSSGASGYLQVSALTLGGYTSVTVKIRDSSDDVAYADLLTFDNVTDAPGGAAESKEGGQRKTATGTVDRYTKTTWAFNGSGSSQSIKFMTGFVRN